MPILKMNLNGVSGANYDDARPSGSKPKAAPKRPRSPKRWPGARARRASALPLLQGFGLAARVLAVTVGFVFLAMGLFYVTRLTAHREMLLHGKIGAVQTTVEAFGLAGPTPPPHDLVAKDPQQRRRQMDGDRNAGRTPRVRHRGRPAGGRRVDHGRRHLLFREHRRHLSRPVRRARDGREAERSGAREPTGDRVRLRRDAADSVVAARVATIFSRFR